jgi:hypothetical protein
LDPDYNPCNYYASKSNTEFIEISLKRGFTCTKAITDHVALNGHFGIIKYLHSVSRPFNSEICTTVDLWNLESMALLYQNGCGINKCTMVAARTGNLRMVKLLRAMNCYWDADVNYNTIRDGHLDVLPNWIDGWGQPIASKIHT